MIASSERVHFGYDAVNYYSYDPHGSVVSIGGKTYTYDAFGNQTNDIANDTNPFRYNGEYIDNETGYIYLRARYYDPSIGRFTTEDPVKDGLNWYVYCSNNPVMFVDPSGMKLKTKNAEDAEELLIYVRNITGDMNYKLDGFELVYDDDYNETTEFQGGSEIGRALIRALSENSLVIGVTFTDKKEGKNQSSSGNTRNIDLVRQSGFEDNPTMDMLAEFVHEATHALVERDMYEKLTIICRDGISFADKRAYEKYIQKKYQEAAALLVESSFREEMGILPRADGVKIGTNEYGTFPSGLNGAVISGDFSIPSDPKLNGNVTAFILKSYGPGLDSFLKDNYGY